MVVDLALVTVLVLGTGSSVQLVGLLLPDRIWFARFLPAAVSVVVTLIPLAYFFLTIAFTGRTLGKALMGIEVQTLDGKRLSAVRSFIRAVAYLVSIIPLFAGFFWVLVDRDRRAWHDHIAGTRVVFNRSDEGE
jgi:uncharacterized RDD family membrane protein YckC